MKKYRRRTPIISFSLRDRLKKAGIRHYSKLIHDQKKDWILKNFKRGRTKKYPINIAGLMRNLVWQMKERVDSGEKEFKEMIRTYWYMYVKPTLARTGVLAEETDQYKQLVSNVVDMVKYWKVMEYKDIGFRDENQAHRKVGVHANIIPFSEKIGHHEFLREIQEQYNVSIIALGGQPSVMNVEYFVDNIKKTHINLKRSFYLFSIVDYDPSGWIIRDAFLNDLRHYGIKQTRVYDLINPDMLTREEIMMARYPIKAGADMEDKNSDWLREVLAKHYKNQKYLVEKQQDGKLKLYGLEAEAISTKRLREKLEKVMKPVIGGDERELKIYEMKDLDQAIGELILFKVTHPEETYA